MVIVPWQQSCNLFDLKTFVKIEIRGFKNNPSFQEQCSIVQIYAFLWLISKHIAKTTLSSEHVSDRLDFRFFFGQ